MTGTKWITPALLAAGMALAALPASQAADAQTPVSVRVEAEGSMARTVDTVSDDLRLINRCIDGGQSKAECLCITQVLKYEMPLVDYRRVARANVVVAKATTSGRRADKLTTTPRNADIQSVASAPNFEYRCEAARRYFSAAR